MKSRQESLAIVTESGCALFIVIMTAFHFIQPELNPVERFGSEYALGRLGWIMNVAFLSLALGLAAFAAALGRALRPAARSRVGQVLFAIAALGILGSGLFNADPNGEAESWHGIGHAMAGLVAFLSMLPAMVVVSRRLHRANALADGYRVLRLLAWVDVALFLAMLFLFGPLGLAGLGQRIFLIGLFAWLLITAEGLRSGAFEANVRESRNAQPSDGAARLIRG
jgi:hypothetical membrane protein